MDERDSKKERSTGVYPKDVKPSSRHSKEEKSSSRNSKEEKSSSRYLKEEKLSSRHFKTQTSSHQLFKEEYPSSQDKFPLEDVISSTQLTDEDKEILEEYYSPQAVIYDPLKAGSIDGTDTVPHDRGVYRAMFASYHPPPTQNDPKKTVIIAKLNAKTTEEKLTRAFSEFGKIKSCKLIRCLVTGMSRRYAFVEYEDSYGAMMAYKRGNKMQLDDAVLLVDFECEHLLPGWIPRRLGGGFGGKKESGQLRFGSRDRPFRMPIPLMSKAERECDLAFR